MSGQDQYGVYRVPQWLEPYLGLLGGPENVQRLMSGRRADVYREPTLAIAQERMAAQIDVLRRLNEAGLLSPAGQEEDTCLRE